jgi:hypothetical protein
MGSIFRGPLTGVTIGYYPTPGLTSPATGSSAPPSSAASWPRSAAQPPRDGVPLAACGAARCQRIALYGAACFGAACFSTHIQSHIQHPARRCGRRFSRAAAAWQVTGRADYPLASAESMVRMLDDRNGVSDGTLDFDEFRVRRATAPPAPASASPATPIPPPFHRYTHRHASAQPTGVPR